MNDYRTPTVKYLPFAMCAAILLTAAAHAEPTIGTAFTYQGQLKSAGVPYTGDAAFQFTLWDAAVDGTRLTDPLSVRTTVENGLFQAELDFGDAPFQVARPLWLEISVETDRGSARLQPRQPITPAPFALFALNAPATGGSELTLPYTGTTTSTSVGFGVLQSGLAGSGAFSIDNPDNTQPVMTLATMGSGPGLLSTAYSGPAIWGRTGVGGGNAGYFETLGTDNTQPALAAENKASGPAAYFRTAKGQSTSPALVSESQSDGSAAQFVTTLDPNNANLEPTLTSTNDSFGSAGEFILTHADNRFDALTGQTIGSGDAVAGFTSGSGRAGVFEVDNIAVRTQPALEATTNARGGSAGLFRTTNGLNASAALVGEADGNNTAVLGIAQGLGDAVFGHAAFGGNAVRGLVEGSSGKAGTFQITEPSNAESAVEGTTAGSGAAGYFENSNTSGTTVAIHAKVGSPGGWAGYFDGRGYFSRNLGIGTDEPRAMLEIADGVGTLFKAGSAMTLTTSGASIGGWVNADQYRFHVPKTNYYSIGAADFSLNKDGNYGMMTGSVPGIGAGEGETEYMYAPVHLPHGARLTEFRVFWYSSNTQPITFQLEQRSLRNGTYAVMGEIRSAATAGGYQEQSTTDVITLPIDNRAFAYYIRADSFCFGGTFGPDGWCQGVEVMGASISYTVTEAD